MKSTLDKKNIEKKVFRWDSRIIQWIEVLIDTVIVFFAFYFSSNVKAYLEMQTIIPINEFILVTPWMVFGIIIASILLFLIYQTSITIQRLRSAMVKIGISFFFMFLILETIYLINFFARSQAYQNNFNWLTIISGLLIAYVIILLVKLLFVVFIKRKYKGSLLIVGTKKEVDKLIKKFLVINSPIYVLKYIIYENDILINNPSLMYKLIDDVDKVYMAQKTNWKLKGVIINYCFNTNKTYVAVPQVYEIALSNSEVEHIGDTIAYKIGRFNLTKDQTFVKRLFDLFISSFALIVATPIFIFIPILMKIMEPKAPIFIKQERLTYKNRTFLLYKFRTMVPNAEALTGPVLSSGKKDPRITRLGSILRKTRIDEIPQFINIFKGDMSFVGPRPEREFFVKKFIEENENYRYRMNVKAGLTGLAQAIGKYNTSFEDKLGFDLYYITNYSFLKDIKIIFQTVNSVLNGTTQIEYNDDVSYEEILNKNNYNLKKMDIEIESYLVSKDDKKGEQI